MIVSGDFIFTESVSGRHAQKRPEFQKMIALAKQPSHPIDVILVWKFSRFARNQDESTFYKSMLRKKLGIDVVSVSEPLIDGMYGRLIDTISMAMVPCPVATAGSSNGWMNTIPFDCRVRSCVA